MRRPFTGPSHSTLALTCYPWHEIQWLFLGDFFRFRGKKTATLRFTPASMEIASGNLRFHDLASGDAEVARVFFWCTNAKDEVKHICVFLQTSEIKTIQMQCYGKTGCIITSKDTRFGSPAKHVDSHRDHRVYCKKNNTI